MESEDKWIKAMRQQLEDYEINPSADLWQKIETELKTPSVHTARVVPLWIRTVAAAAAVVCVAGGSWLYFSRYLDRPTDNITARRAVSTPKAEILAKQKSRPLNRSVKTLNRPMGATVSALGDEAVTASAPEKEVAVQSAVDADSMAIPDASQNMMAMSAAPVAATDPETPDISNERTEEDVEKPVSKEKPQNWYDNIPENDRKKMDANTAITTSADKKHWAVSLTAMNGLPSIGGNLGRGEAMASTMSDVSANLRPFGSAAVGGYATMDQTLLSDKQAVVRTSTSVKHKIPVSYGASVRYNFTPEWGVETGLSYTMLSSSFTNERMDNRVSYDQNLHYLEIPVRVNYLFVNQRWFSVYAAGGGAVAKCVYAKIDGSDTQNYTLDEKPWQFSLTGAVGAQLNIVEHVGIYLEPGVGYYFKDNSNLRTVYKDHPWVFKLNFGLRLSY